MTIIACLFSVIISSQHNRKFLFSFPSYWCTAEEEEVVYETPTKTVDSETAENVENVENVEGHTEATYPHAESYCDCLQPSECATFVDLFHQGRFHELTYFESCGYYEYQPYFCCPPLAAEHAESHEHADEHADHADHAEGFEYHTEQTITHVEETPERR